MKIEMQSILEKSNIFRLMAHRLHDTLFRLFFMINLILLQYLKGPDNYDYHAFFEMMKLFEIFKIFLKNCLIMVDI